MTIHLSKDLEVFVHKAVQSGLYDTEDDVVNDALNLLKRSMSEGAAASERRAREPRSEQKKKPLTRDEFDKQLLAIGLISQLPDSSTDFDDSNDVPIRIEGEPLSETIIRERR